jgi:hypothetical protein
VSKDLKDLATAAGGDAPKLLARADNLQKARMQKAASRAYENFGAAVGSTVRSGGNAIKQLSKTIDAERTSAGVGDNPAAALLRGAAGRFAAQSEKPAAKMGAKDLLYLRDQVGQMFERPPDGMDLGVLKRVYGAVSKDLKDLATAAGGDAPKLLARADNLQKARIGRMERLDKVTGATAGGQAGERLARMAREGGGIDSKAIALARKTMQPAEFDEMASGVLSTMGRASADQPATFDRFVTDWAKMDGKAKALLFRKDARAALDDLAEVGRRFKEAGAARNTSNTAGAMTTMTALQGLPGLIDPLYVLGTFAGPAAVARMLAKPAAVKSAKRFVSASVNVSPRLVRRSAFMLAQEFAKSANLSSQAQRQAYEALVSGAPAMADENDAERP